MTFAVRIHLPFGPDHTGIGEDGNSALTYRVRKSDSSFVAAATSAGVVERVAGSGNYQLTLTADTGWGDWVDVLWYISGVELTGADDTLPTVSMSIDLTVQAELDGLATAVAGIPTGGVGPLTRTVLVVDGNEDPVVGAAVGMSGGRAGVTDAEGEVVFHHTAGTFTIVAAVNGYDGASSGPIALTADGTTELTLEALSIDVPAEPGLATGWCITYDGHGAPDPDVTLTFAMVDPYPDDEDAGAATSWTRRNFTAVSDADALLQTTFKRSGSYRGKRDGDWVAFTVPDAGSFELPKTLSRAGS